MQVVTISSWLNFGGPAPPERGSAAGRKFLAPRYYGQRAVFASLLALFFIYLVIHETNSSQYIQRIQELYSERGWLIGNCTD